MTKVLFTGFEPFDGGATNPSWPAAERAAAAWTGPGSAAAVLFPVSFSDTPRLLAQALRSHDPTVVVAAGLGPTRAVSVERIAVNIMDARIPDNEGAQPVDAEVLPGQPLAYRASLPVKTCASALHTAGFPVQVSSSAGTFVCNQMFYLLCDWVANGADARVGFIHLPWPGRVSGYSPLTVDRMAAALQLVAATTVVTGNDEKIALSEFTDPAVTSTT
jgi:pyroglutamyl-peptidase